MAEIRKSDRRSFVTEHSLYAKTRVSAILTLILLLILLTAVRIGSAQPSVETLPATNITENSAQLNGRVETNGQDTYYYFFISAPGGEHFWCPSQAGATVHGSISVSSVNCVLNNLQPSTTYYFFLAGGWLLYPEVHGSELSFTTLTQVFTVSVSINPTIVTGLLTSTTSQPTAPGFDFTLSVSPSTVSMEQGGTAHYAVYLTYSDPSFAGTVINLQLTGLGPGMSWHVTPSGGLTISTDGSTPPGTYPITLTGSANGVIHQTGATLIVTSAQPTSTAVATTIVTTPPATTSGTAFDYSVSVAPSTQTVEIGGSTSYLVSVLSLAGSSVPVSLTLVGVPGDVRSSFTVLSGNAPYLSTLNLDLSTSSANAGACTLTILATAAGNVKTATATLVITAKAAQATTSQTTISGSSWSDVLQQNLSLVLILLVVVLGVVGFSFGRRGGRSPKVVSAPSGFCASCGAVMEQEAQFCRKCGARRPRG